MNNTLGSVNFITTSKLAGYSLLLLLVLVFPYASFVSSENPPLNSNIDVDLWQTFEFDNLTVANLNANDGGATGGTWRIVDSRSLLSMSLSAEKDMLSTVNDTIDNGTRGFIHISSAYGDSHIRWDFDENNSPTALSWGFWFKVSSNWKGSFDEHDIFVSHRHLGNTNVYIKMTDDNNIKIQLFKEGFGYTAGVDISGDTWYWITGKWVLNSGSYVRIYDDLGNPVGTEQSIPSSVNNDVISDFEIGSYIGRTNPRIGTLYFDDLLVDWTNAQYPLGPRGVPTQPDTQAPAVSISSPANGTILGPGNKTITAIASDDFGIVGVQFLLDRVNFGSEDTNSPYSATWNTSTATNGPHLLSAIARDAAGHTTIATDVNVIIDSQAPTGSVVVNNGAAATNSRGVVLTLSAVDNVSAISQMRFSNTSSSFSVAEPYATTKNWTLTTGAGTKTVYVQFKDAVGNWSSSFTDTIILDTTAPTLSNILAASITASGATITWTTNEPAMSQVEYGLTTAYGLTTTLDTNLGTAHGMTLTGLSPKTKYNYRVRSKDAAGNEKISANKTFTTL